MIKRKAANAYLTEDTNSYQNAICQNCYENNCTVRLEKYPPDPEHFLNCPNCGSIRSKKSLRYSSKMGVLGKDGGIAPPTYEAIEKKTRITKNIEYEPEFNPSDYPIAGKEDGDLVYFNSIGVVTNVIDSNVNEEE